MPGKKGAASGHRQKAPATVNEEISIPGRRRTRFPMSGLQGGGPSASTAARSRFDKIDIPWSTWPEGADAPNKRRYRRRPPHRHGHLHHLGDHGIQVPPTGTYGDDGEGVTHGGAGRCRIGGPEGERSWLAGDAAKAGTNQTR